MSNSQTFVRIFSMGKFCEWVRSTNFPWPSPPHSNYFLFSSSFVVTVGDINFLSHTHSLHSSLLLEKPDSRSFISTSTLGQLTEFFFLRFFFSPLFGSLFFFRLCGRMLGWLAVEDLVSQVAVGGQICWQSDRLTHLGHCSSAHSFPPCCIPARAGATDPPKPLHPPTKICMIWNIGPWGKHKRRTFPTNELSSTL